MNPPCPLFIFLIVYAAWFESATSARETLYACTRAGQMLCVPEDGNFFELPQPMGVGLPQDIAFHQRLDTMFGVTGYDSVASKLFTVDLDTGVASVVGAVSGLSTLRSLAYRAANDTLYAVDNGSGAGRLLTINPDASHDIIGTIIRTNDGRGVSINGIDFAPDGRLLGTGTTGVGQGVREIYEINPDSAEATFLGFWQDISFMNDIAFDPSDGRSYGVRSTTTGGNYTTIIYKTDPISGSNAIELSLTNDGGGYNIGGIGFLNRPMDLSLDLDGDEVNLCWRGYTNWSYRIQWAPDLFVCFWEDLATVTGTGMLMYSTAPPLPNFHGFYRLANADSGLMAVLQEISFGGDDYFPILDGDGEPHDAPHWQDNSDTPDGDVTDATDRRVPVGFTANATMEISAKWVLQLPIFQEISAIQMRGDGPGALDFPPTHPIICGSECRIMDVVCNSALPEEVPDPLVIRWEISLDHGVTWASAGTSSHQIQLPAEPGN